MDSLSSRSQKFLFLTTLIDLLVQLVFLFIVIYHITDSKISDLEKTTGLTLESISKSWRQLVSIDSVKSTISVQENEIARLREENAKLKEDKERHTGKGGIDKPPCWLTSGNQPEYLLKIRILEDGLFVSRAWPDERMLEVSMHNLDEIALNRIFSVEEFSSTFGPFARHPVFQNCAHFVVVADKSSTKSSYIRHLTAIESLFYKRLVRS